MTVANHAQWVLVEDGLITLPLLLDYTLAPYTSQLVRWSKLESDSRHLGDIHFGQWLGHEVAFHKER